MDSYEEYGSSVGFIHSGSISTNDKGNRVFDGSEERENPAFFSYYRGHSIQLVNALVPSGPMRSDLSRVGTSRVN